MYLPPPSPPHDLTCPIPLPISLLDKECQVRRYEPHALLGQDEQPLLVQREWEEDPLEDLNPTLYPWGGDENLLVNPPGTSERLWYVLDVVCRHDEEYWGGGGGEFVQEAPH
jgi:hypothetical protein